jgi:lysophospholipase L1-like esterase
MLGGAWHDHCPEPISLVVVSPAGARVRWCCDSLAPVRLIPIVAFIGLAACGGSNTATVHFMGRFDPSDPAGPRFSFSGSQISTRFDGSSLRVTLAEEGANQYSVRVDGQEQPVLSTEPGTHSYELVTGLPAGVHDLELIRRTEAFFGVTQFLGFEDAPLVASPPRQTRFIELVGDSITCGYGVLGDGPTCAFGPDSESEPDAYGALAAVQLEAAHASIAYSGKGVFQNYGGEVSALVPEVYGRVFGDAPEPAWSFSGYTPDVVVVNLGTNDYWNGDPGPGFEMAYEAFLTQVRAHHANAWIVVVLSPMLSEGSRASARTRLESVVAAAHVRGDERVDFLELDEQDEADGLGCDYHPGRATQRKMADRLVRKLRELTGW